MQSHRGSACALAVAARGVSSGAWSAAQRRGARADRRAVESRNAGYRSAVAGRPCRGRDVSGKQPRATGDRQGRADTFPLGRARSPARQSVAARTLQRLEGLKGLERLNGLWVAGGSGAFHRFKVDATAAGFDGGGSILDLLVLVHLAVPPITECAIFY